MFVTETTRLFQENISKYLKAARAFGQIEFELFETEDLASLRNLKQVVSSIHALGRTTQEKVPELAMKLGTKVVKGVSVLAVGGPCVLARVQPAVFACDGVADGTGEAGIALAGRKGSRGSKLLAKRRTEAVVLGKTRHGRDPACQYDHLGGDGESRRAAVCQEHR